MIGEVTRAKFCCLARRQRSCMTTGIPRCARRKFAASRWPRPCCWEFPLCWDGPRQASILRSATCVRIAASRSRADGSMASESPASITDGRSNRFPVSAARSLHSPAPTLSILRESTLRRFPARNAMAMSGSTFPSPDAAGCGQMVRMACRRCPRSRSSAPVTARRIWRPIFPATWITASSA